MPNKLIQKIVDKIVEKRLAEEEEQQRNQPLPPQLNMRQLRRNPDLVRALIAQVMQGAPNPQMMAIFNQLMQLYAQRNNEEEEEEEWNENQNDEVVQIEEENQVEIQNENQIDN